MAAGHWKTTNHRSTNRALGEQKASFYGASYGSALGAAYISLFPDTTDRSALATEFGITGCEPPTIPEEVAPASESATTQAAAGASAAAVPTRG